MIKLSQISKVLAGQAAPKEFSDDGFPFIRAGHLESLLSGIALSELPKVSVEIAKKYKLKLLEKGAILFAKSGMSATLNRVYILKQHSYFVSHLAAIVPNECVNIDFLSRYISWFNPSNLILDSAYPSIRLEDINNLQIPLPPLPQQQKIANILDAADALRQKDKALLGKYDELTQALFLDMFGDPVSNPKGWEKQTLKSVCNKITDGTHFSPEPQPNGFPYITAKHVKNYGLDFYSKPTYVSEMAHDEIYKRCTPEFGDVLYIKDGATTGIACINTFNEPFSMLSSLALIKPNKSLLDSCFLCYWLNNPKIKNKLLSEFMSGAAIQRYTLTKINSFNLIVPLISLQNQFAERVKVIEQQKAIALKSLEKSEQLFNSLLQQAFKGELV